MNATIRIALCVLWLAFAALCWAELKGPTIALSKDVLNKGGWLVVSCGVPSSHKNKLLRFGIENDMPPAEIWLDGYNSAPEYHRGYAVECGQGVGFCVVLNSDAQWSPRATRSFTVKGCES